MAGAQRLQPSSAAWLVIIDSSHPAAAATRADGSRTRHPSLAFSNLRAARGSGRAEELAQRRLGDDEEDGEGGDRRQQAHSDG